MNKCIRVIKSCQTLQQLEVADKYRKRYIDRRFEEIPVFDLSGGSIILFNFLQKDIKKIDRIYSNKHLMLSIAQKEKSWMYIS